MALRSDRRVGALALTLGALAVLVGLSRAMSQPAVETKAAIRTPRAPATPRINGPRVYGARPGRPFLYQIPATGERPMTFAARGLPAGLVLDQKTGLISGRTTGRGHHRVTLTASNARGKDSAILDLVIGDTICLTPPLGWNSWNHFHRNIDDAKVRAAADAMVASGLREHGWSFINIDDCWQGARDEQGRIRANEKFPDMRALADYVHGKGLKFGIYSSPGPQTCAGFTGSYRHEDQDALMYAAWGVDYVKYDWCSYGQIAPLHAEQKYAERFPEFANQLKTLAAQRTALLAKRPRTQEESDRLLDDLRKLDEIHAKMDPEKKKAVNLEVLQEPYQLFRASMDRVDRDIVYSFCQYGMGNVWEWGREAGGNCWRTTGDISPSWESLSRIGFSQNGLEKWAGPGHWNDPDMLEIGNGNLTPDEMYTHMTLWCLLSAPLLIGCDMTRMDDLVVSLFSNDEVLAVNQDPLGRQGYRVKQDGTNEVWIKPLTDGTTAVGFFNRGEPPATVAVRWSELKLSGNEAVRDLWRQKDLGRQPAGLSATVAPHGAELFRVGSPRAAARGASVAAGKGQTRGRSSRDRHGRAD